jgi:hypothetical protein
MAESVTEFEFMLDSSRKQRGLLIAGAFVLFLCGCISRDQVSLSNLNPYRIHLHQGSNCVAPIDPVCHGFHPTTWTPMAPECAVSSLPAARPTTEVPAPKAIPGSREMPDVLPAREAPTVAPAVSTDEPLPLRPEPAQAAEPSENPLSEPADDANKRAAVEPVAPMQEAGGRLTSYLAETETALPQEERDGVGTSTETDFSAANESPGGTRLWVDSTGQKQVRARLVSVGQKHVVLLKDTGKYTTVPLDRLSQDDLAFVRRESSSVMGGKF